MSDSGAAIEFEVAQCYLCPLMGELRGMALCVAGLDPEELQNSACDSIPANCPLRKGYAIVRLAS